ncbi:hypothetical protein CPJCM30710_25490 [Clostridium polyendosporum]|uniref:Uncharacterized protein n=1 Tax=Clostridium polyendosporum TaxID=69208 RepID=A0A919VMS9_9CLOT|nr:hypothetical protein [Clostridium polyendosporum]GIM29883.1 hypothetical protein CPJCM30710_25490 [Clostridium polyendosporum]
MKYKFNTRWNGKQLKCACLFGNACCDRFKKCEVLELTMDPFDGIKECMGQRKYVRENGALKQK